MTASEGPMMTSKRIRLAPSILSADFARLGEQVAEAEAAGADYIHVDVMDGHFVPNLTIGPMVVEALRSRTHLPLDVHLMITEPERWVGDYAAAGAHFVTFHAEATPHLHRTIQLIKDCGVKVGISINPGTPPSAIKEVLPLVDLVLVMSVNPGWGGQSFIPGSLQKLEKLRRMLDDIKSPAELEVDGGVNPKTASAVISAGADVLVAGSAVFNKKENVAEAIAHLRDSFGGK